MTQVPRSEQFDDVYFSVQDGLAETRHVFIDGNGLPEFWQGRDQFTICETGFGTGLNFLAALSLWQSMDAKTRPQNVHFISFEKFPLTKNYIRDYLSHWEEIRGALDMLLSVYPDDISAGRHDLEICEGINLSLIFGDVNEEMPKLLNDVDCWFLDGFKPSSNPDMWSETVFENMARLSVNMARFATFTAAGFVRRGLEGCGFNVRKVPGYGRKREMCVGIYQGGQPCA